MVSKEAFWGLVLYMPPKGNPSKSHQQKVIVRLWLVNHWLNLINRPKHPMLQIQAKWCPKQEFCSPFPLTHSDSWTTSCHWLTPFWLRCFLVLFLCIGKPGILNFKKKSSGNANWEKLKPMVKHREGLKPSHSDADYGIMAALSWTVYCFRAMTKSCLVKVCPVSATWESFFL